MEIIVDKSMAALGITDVVIGIARHLNPNAPLGEAFEQKLCEKEQWALQADADDIATPLWRDTRRCSARWTEARRKTRPPFWRC